VKVEAKKVKNANNRNSSDFLKDFDTKYGLRRDDPHELPRSRDFHKWEGLQSTIRVVNVELRTEVLDIIGPALLHNPYKTVHFEKNMLDRKGVLFVIEYLKRNDAAENFFFDGMLSGVVSNHPSLKRVDLVHCSAQNTVPAFISSIIPACRRLKTLRLTENNLTTNGNRAIADCLASNPALQDLCLRGNRFNDDDAEIVAAALMTNTNLWKLDLKKNNIGRRGFDALLKAIFNPKSLNTASSSNHTCDIYLSCFKIPRVNGEVWGRKNGASRVKKFALLAGW
jgi:hypothetical protein